MCIRDRYNKHLKRIIDLSTLNSGNKNKLSGTTSKDAGHVHEYSMDSGGNGWAAMAVSPKNPNIKHEHKIVNWVVQPAQSECYPDCVEGAPLHTHKTNNDTLLALGYINKVVRKKMKGLGQIYGDKGTKKEQLVGQMLSDAVQKGILSY